jgi:hypothetical protein
MRLNVGFTEVCAPRFARSDSRYTYGAVAEERRLH